MLQFKGFMKNIMPFLRRTYFLISGFILSIYPFWFGLEFLKEWSPTVTSFLKDNWGYLICPSIIGFLWREAHSWFLEKAIIKISGEKDKLNSDIIELSEALKDLSNDLLRDFSKEQLDAENGAPMRMSLYVSDEKNTCLYCVSRYSKNQKYGDISGDKIYGSNGIIGKVWIEGNLDGFGVFDNDFPDPNFGNSLKTYKRNQLERYGISNEGVDGMKMKSRLYYAYRVQSDSHLLGVILIESLSPSKYAKQDLDDHIKDLEHRLLMVLKSTKNYLRQPMTYTISQM